MLAAMQLATPHQLKRKARILVVDDDPGLLRLLTIRLRAENYEVEAVESAALALAATSRFRPELVITDLRMDQMDGIGLLKELQSRYPGLKVIILTAHGTIPDAVHATREEQQYLETVFRHYFPERDVEVLDSWSGLRVLPAGTGSASRRSRETELWLDSATDPKVLAIYGGKLTGYRLTARKVLHRLGPTLGPATPRADTATLRLPDPRVAARETGAACGTVERSRSP